MTTSSDIWHSILFFCLQISLLNYSKTGRWKMFTCPISLSFLYLNVTFLAFDVFTRCGMIHARCWGRQYKPYYQDKGISVKFLSSNKKQWRNYHWLKTPSPKDLYILGETYSSKREWNFLLPFLIMSCFSLGMKIVLIIGLSTAVVVWVSNSIWLELYSLLLQ